MRQQTSTCVNILGLETGKIPATVNIYVDAVNISVNIPAGRKHYWPGINSTISGIARVKRVF